MKKPRKKTEQKRSEDEILLESQRHAIKEMVHKEKEEWGSKHTNRGEKTELKVAYANVNGIITALLMLNDFIRENKPDIMGIRD